MDKHSAVDPMYIYIYTVNLLGLSHYSTSNIQSPVDDDG